MKKLSQAIALSAGTGLLITQISDILINQDKKQVLKKSTHYLVNSMKYTRRHHHLVNLRFQNKEKHEGSDTQKKEDNRQFS